MNIYRINGVYCNMMAYVAKNKAYVTGINVKKNTFRSRLGPGEVTARMKMYEREISSLSRSFSLAPPSLHRRRFVAIGMKRSAFLALF